MMLTDEDLLAISNLLDVKINAAVQPLKDDVTLLKDDVTHLQLQMENIVIPQIKLLAENYVPAAKRFEHASSQIESIQVDMDIVKNVVSNHSEILQKVSL